MFIPDPGSGFFHPGVKKAPDPGSGSATLAVKMSTYTVKIKNRLNFKINIYRLSSMLVWYPRG
jgi:hypothetical protein